MSALFQNGRGQIDAILFDMDGTLIDSLPLHCKSYQRAFSDFNLTLTEAQYYSNIGGTALECIPKFLGEQKTPVSFKELHQRKKEYSIKLLDEIGIEPLETAKLLDVFEDTHMVMGIGSAGSRVFIDAVIEKLRWAKYFDVVLSAEDVENGKPDPEVYLKLAKQLEVRPSRCVVFEDQPDGIEAAKRAGMRYFDVNKTVR